MLQLQLPIFLAGSTLITPSLAFECRDGRVTYFHGQMPVFSHAEDDSRTFQETIETLKDLLASGMDRAAAARQLGLKPNTVAKAMRDGRVRGKKSPLPGTQTRGSQAPRASGA
jgi:hypothetical protein